MKRKQRRTAEQLGQDCLEAIGQLGGGDLIESQVGSRWCSASAKMARPIHIHGAESPEDALEQLLIVLLLRIEQGYAA